LFVTKPFVWLWLLIFKTLILPLYSFAHKTKFKSQHVYQDRHDLYQKLSKYFSYSFLILLVLLTTYRSLEANNTAPEDFGKDTLIFSLTKTGEDFIDNENITEGPITTNDKVVDSFLKNEALSEDDVIIEPDLPDNWQDSLTIFTPDDSALEAPEIGDPSMIQTKRTEVIEYVIESGDVLGSIAEKFEINVATLLWANDLTVYSVIRPGQKLKILPTNGLIYKVKKNDTLDAIAKQYQSDVNKIIEANKLASANSLQIGQDLLLPGGIKPNTYAPTTRSVASVFKPEPAAATSGGGGELLWPTNSTRITQYYGWRHSGLDIGNKKGQPIYASEAGKVETAGWNSGGYGYYVIINHGNGLQTLYAHASELYIAKGDSVSRGDVIAAIGSTGWSTGPHIHYEVRVNGTRVNPLDYIK